MRKKNYKGRCEKRTFSNCPGVCKTIDAIQSAYAEMLQNDDTIVEFRPNVLLEGLEIGEFSEYGFRCKQLFYCLHLCIGCTKDNPRLRRG